jgi:nucleoside-diphosphate-sugar epimerase
MKILITGNMGYVGPMVVRHLEATFPGCELIGADSGFFAHCLTTPAGLPERRLSRQHFVDVRDLTDAHFRGIDAVVHLAAISNDPMGKAYEEVTSEVNWRASVRTAELAKKNGVGRYVFASSCSVYGLAEGVPRDEDAELNPLTAYARSKRATEASVEGLADESFRVTCLRFPTACGMSDRLRLDLVLNDFVASAVVSRRIEVLSDGSPWRPLIDVRDMARAIEWGIVRENDQGGDFIAINAGRDECNQQVRDLAHAVRAVMPEVEIKINENAQPDKRSYQVDFGRYRVLAPDHQPQVALSDSILALKEGLEAIGFDQPDFRNSGFMRLRVLSDHRESGRLDDQLRWVPSKG